MTLLVTVFFFHQMVNHFFSFNGYYHQVARTPEYLQWDVRPKCGDVNAVAPGWCARLVVPWLSQFTVHLHTGDWLTMLNLQKSLFDSKFYQELQVNWIKNIFASLRECFNNKIWSNGKYRDESFFFMKCFWKTRYVMLSVSYMLFIRCAVGLHWQFPAAQQPPQPGWDP